MYTKTRCTDVKLKCPSKYSFLTNNLLHYFGATIACIFLGYDYDFLNTFHFIQIFIRLLTRTYNEVLHTIVILLFVLELFPAYELNMIIPQYHLTLMCTVYLVKTASSFRFYYGC